MKRSTPMLVAVLAAVVLAVSGAVATPASAAGNPVIQDCYTHGKLTRSYPPAQLKQALHSMSAYIKQYTSCQTVIESALQNPQKVTDNGTGGGGGGSSISTGLIVVIIVVVVAIVAFGALLMRRRRTPGDDGEGGP
jgi:predicted PurR-regulated permease PerM